MLNSFFDTFSISFYNISQYSISHSLIRFSYANPTFHLFWPWDRTDNPHIRAARLTMLCSIAGSKIPTEFAYGAGCWTPRLCAFASGRWGYLGRFAPDIDIVFQSCNYLGSDMLPLSSKRCVRIIRWFRWLFPGTSRHFERRPQAWCLNARCARFWRCQKCLQVWHIWW